MLLRLSPTNPSGRCSSTLCSTAEFPNPYLHTRWYRKSKLVTAVVAVGIVAIVNHARAPLCCNLAPVVLDAVAIGEVAKVWHIQILYGTHGTQEHGGQIKRLRKAIGNGTRLRVGSYAESAVLKAIADADIVFFGIDRDEPVLSGEQVRDLRDFAVRELTVVDFNTFHSTTGLEAISGVTVIDAEQLDESVRDYADGMCALPEFDRAVREAESWIVKHAPPTNGECSKPRSCLGLVGDAAGESAHRNATRAEDRWRHCAVCTGRQETLVDAPGGVCHD